VSVAVSSNETLYFKNLCSGIKFSVAHDNINKVVIKSGDGSNSIAGQVNANISEPSNPVSESLGTSSSVVVNAPDGECFKVGSFYYVPIIPGTKSQGIEIEFYATNNTVGTYRSHEPAEFKRSVVKRASEKDKDIKFRPHYGNTAVIITGSILPENVDRTKITNVLFEVNSDKTTDCSIPSNGAPVYFEQDGTTATYYTSAEVYSLLYAEAMFSGWTALETIDLSHVITDGVESFCQMFYNCRNLRELDVSGFDTANCKNFSSMFYNCSSLQSLDVTGFDTSRAEYMFDMFFGCENLRSIDVRGFDTRNVNRIEGMFGHCASLTELDLSSFNFCSVIALDRLFGNCCNLVHIEADFSTADPGNLLYIRQMFEGCKKLESIDLTGLRTDNVIWMNAMFRQCVSLKSIDLSGFNTANVQLMDMMFESCCSLTSIDISSFDTSSVTEMSFMFDGCSRLKRLDLSHFDTRNVTNMSCMFRNCMSLADLDISSFNAASLTNATEMFCFDFRLASLNMGSFDLSGADITTSGSLTGRDSKRCNVKCIPATKNALINKSSGFTSDIFVWYGENDEMPAYQEEIDPTLYYSTDYSKDGTTKTIQTASSGSGVDIVLMGDAYSDRLIADGTYDNDMQKVIDAIFTIEPFKSLKELFNIYVVYVVSDNEVIGKSTALATYDVRSGYGAIGTADSWRHEVYTRKATSKFDFREVTPIIVLNSPVSDGAVWTTLHHAQDDYLDDPDWDDYHGGESVAYVSGPNDAGFGFTVRHECGHALGQLADEYISYDQEIDSYEKLQLQWGMNYGQWKNIDFTSDSEAVKWKSFIMDSRYSSSGIGVYEGGAKYTTGVWRPTENSIMNSDANGQYNAPSREAIYYRINKIAYGKSWQYDYETFVQQDLKNIDPATRSSYVEAPYPARIEQKGFFKIEESVSADGQKKVTVIMN
jgi:surface protein